MTSVFETAQNEVSTAILACDYIDPAVLSQLTVPELVVISADAGARASLAEVARPNRSIQHVDGWLASASGSLKVRRYEPSWLNATVPLAKGVDRLLPKYREGETATVQAVPLAALNPICRDRPTLLLLDIMGDLSRLFVELQRFAKDMGPRLKIIMRVSKQEFHRDAIGRSAVGEFARQIGRELVCATAPVSTFGEWVELVSDGADEADLRTRAGADRLRQEALISVSAQQFIDWSSALHAPADPPPQSIDVNADQVGELEADLLASRAREAKALSDLQGLQDRYVAQGHRVEELETALGDILSRVTVEKPKSTKATKDTPARRTKRVAKPKAPKAG